MRRRLPKIVKGIEPRGLRKQILSEEVFEVFKPQIKVKPLSSGPRPKKNLSLENLEFMRLIKEKYPLHVAAKFGKKKLKNLFKNASKSQRRKAKRYFLRARQTLGAVPRGRKPRYSYNEYINSREWADRRNRFFKAYGRKCAACGTSQKIHLHHMVYTAFDGTEPDDHLVALCELHHNGYHARYGTSRSMIRSTMAYVAEIQGLHKIASNTLQSTASTSS